MNFGSLKAMGCSEIGDGKAMRFGGVGLGFWERSGVLRV